MAPPQAAPRSGGDFGFRGGRLNSADARHRWWVRLGLFVLVAAAHVAVLAWLGRRTPPPQFAEHDPPAPVEVWFVPPPPDRRATAGRRGGFSRPSLRPRIALPPPPASVTDAPPPPPLTPATPPPPIAAEARAALRDSLRRGVLGCANRESAHLSSEERAASDARLVAASPPEPAARRLNLDTRGDFARDETPSLERRPKNGCKPRAAGSKAPSGEQGVAAGVSCAQPF